jgi:hypothetical protein
VRGGHPRITTIYLYLYLYVGQFLTKKRTAQALAELFGTPVSDATVATMTRRAADGLGACLDLVADRVAQAAVAGFGENRPAAQSSLLCQEVEAAPNGDLGSVQCDRQFRAIPPAVVAQAVEDVVMTDCPHMLGTYTIEFRS